jgi:hypothetical protein
MDAITTIPGLAAISDDIAGTDKSSCEKPGIFQMGKSPILCLPVTECADELYVAAITSSTSIDLIACGIEPPVERSIDWIPQRTLEVYPMVTIENTSLDPHRFRPRCAV